MNSMPEDQNLEVISLIEKLLPVPERSPRKVTDGRAKFLSEAGLLKTAISRVPERRHIKWKTIFSRKVQPSMVTISTLVVIFAMVFGGTGATVYAAQSSLPDQPLYVVKLASEDIRSSLAINNQTRLNLTLDFADLRLQEALQLAAKGKAVPGTVWERMEGHYDLALRTTAGFDDEQLRQELRQIQTKLATDIRKLTLLSSDSRYSDDVTKVQVALLIDLKLTSLGMMDPSAFRQYMGSDLYPHGWQTSTPTVSPVPTIWSSMTPAWGSRTPVPHSTWNELWYSPTQMPDNHQNDQWHDNHQNNCCQQNDHSGQHHDSGGWGHP